MLGLSLAAGGHGKDKKKAMEEAAENVETAAAKPKAKRAKTSAAPTLDASSAPVLQPAPKKSRSATAKAGAPPTAMAPPPPLPSKKRQHPEKTGDKPKDTQCNLKTLFEEKKSNSASAQKIQIFQDQETVPEGLKSGSSGSSGLVNPTLQPPKNHDEEEDKTHPDGAGGPLQATPQDPQDSEKKSGDTPTEQKIHASAGTEHAVDQKSSEGTGCPVSKPLRMLNYKEVLPTSLSSWFDADDVLSCEQEVERAKKHPSFAEHLKNIQDEVGEEFDWGSPDGDVLCDLECFILFLQENNKQGELEDEFWTESLAAAIDQEKAKKEASGGAGHGWTFFTSLNLLNLVTSRPLKF